MSVTQAPAPPAGTGLLDRLRRLDVQPDWRRDRPHPESAALMAAVEAAVRDGRLAAVEAAEARARAATLRLDAAAALEALAELACLGPQRRGWVHQQVTSISVDWRLVLESLAPEAREPVQLRAETALRNATFHMPHAPWLRIALADILSTGRGKGAAAADLERALEAGAPVRQRYFTELLEPLAGLPGSEAIARALAIPPSLTDAAAPDYLAFRLLRATALATAGWQCRQAAAEGRLTPRHAATAEALAAVPGQELDMAARLGALLSMLRDCAPPDATGALLLLSLNECFRTSPLPEAEAARVAVLQALLDAQAACGAGGGELRFLTFALVVLLPSTIRFWADGAFRRAACAAGLRRIGELPEPPRSRLGGLLAFGLEDYDRARDCFAAAAAAEPAVAGIGSFVDFRTLPALLAEAAAGPALLGEAGLRFDRLSVPDPAPDARRDGITVIASADDKYLRLYGARYAGSLRGVARPGTRLHLHLIGDPAAMEAECAAIIAAAPDLAVTLSSEPLDIDHNFYFATARFLRLPFLRDTLPGALIVTDIDRGWPGPPEAIAETRLAGADVGLRLMAEPRCVRLPGQDWASLYYPLLAPWHAVNANCLVLADTPGARRFARILARLADAELRRALGRPGRHWGIDQNILFAAYAHAVRAHPDITFADLGWPGEEFVPPSASARPQAGARHWIGDASFDGGPGSAMAG